jgi:AcrR family transcriptional regulator
VFAAQGYHRASIRAIAREADVSVGTVYTRFEHKRSLFLAVLGRHTIGFVPPMREIARREEPATVRLHALTDHLIGYFAANPDFARILFGSSPATGLGVPGAAEADLARGYQVAVDAQEQIFAEGVASGELGPGAPAALSQIYSGMVQGYQIAALAGADLGRHELRALVDKTFVRRHP